MIDFILSQPWWVKYLGAGAIYACFWAWSEKSDKTAGYAMVFIPFLWPLAMWISLGVTIRKIGERWRRGGR